MIEDNDAILSLGTTAIFLLHYAHRVALGYSCDDFVTRLWCLGSKSHHW